MKSTIFKASVFTLALDISLFILFFIFIYPIISVNKPNILICTTLSLIIGSIVNCIIINLFFKKLYSSIENLENDISKLSHKKLDKLNLSNYDDSIKSIPQFINNSLTQHNLCNLKYQNLLNIYNLTFNKFEQGVILLNSKKEIIMHNSIADKILGDVVSLNSNIKNSNIFCSHIIPICDTLSKSNKPLTKIINLPESKKIIEVYVSNLDYNTPDKVNIVVILTDRTEMDRLKKMRDEFAANVTHELKTPLTSIIGYIELLSSEERDAETRKYFYDIIHSESQRLFTLIDDMLLLSQVENMDDSATSQKCNIDKEINETVKQLMPLAKKRNINIEINTESNLSINIPYIRIQQLFSNIIGNAIKYNVDNGKIFINAYKERNNIIINIKDTGIGINPKHIDKIFERFYRSDTSRASGIPGTGLGLAIVKDIVKLYNGDIQVKSELNKGSEFIITLPLFSR